VLVASTHVDVAAPVVVVPASQLSALCAHASARGGTSRDQDSSGRRHRYQRQDSVTTMSANWLAPFVERRQHRTLTNERTTPPRQLFRTLASLVEEFDPLIRARSSR